MQKLKVGDEVIILAGKDRGRTGKLVKLNLKTQKVIVEGINEQQKAVKPTQENPQGGFMKLQKPVHLSNVSMISPKNKRATRVRIEERQGKKVRVAVSCGTVL